MDFQVGVVGVGLAGQQRLDLPAPDDARQFGDRGFRVGDDTFVALRLAELDQPEIVLKLALRLTDGAYRILKMLPFARDLLRLGRIVPEIRVFDAGVQFGEPALGDIPVKDASGSGRSHCGFRRPSSAFRRASLVSKTIGRG